MNNYYFNFKEFWFFLCFFFKVKCCILCTVTVQLSATKTLFLHKMINKGFKFNFTENQIKFPIPFFFAIEEQIISCFTNFVFKVFEVISYYKLVWKTREKCWSLWLTSHIWGNKSSCSKSNVIYFAKQSRQAPVTIWTNGSSWFTRFSW